MGTFNDLRHTPVMVREVMHWLVEARGEQHQSSRYVDVTLGGGGHAASLLEADQEALLLGIDRDRDVLNIAAAALAPWKGRATIAEGTFSDLPALLEHHGWDEVDGIVADLGVSLFQLAVPERGFSFQHEGPLDMRMDQRGGVTASRWLATASEAEMAQVFFDYGEERFSKRIARHLVQRRNAKPFVDTKDLAAEIVRVVGPGRRGSIHPATRVFQAIRIAVNHELEELQALLRHGPRALAAGGRMVVISYHSLEDRLVKRAFRALARDNGFSLPVRRVLTPQADEVQANRRARSAKLRIVERNA